jgi:hypothetical protein
LEEGLGIEVSTSSSRANKEVEKQMLLGLNQIMAQNYAGLIQVAQLTQDPQMLQAAVMAAWSGGTEMIKRLLEAHDIENAERFLPAPMGQGGNGPGAQPPQIGSTLGGPQAPQPIIPGAAGALGGILGIP